MRGLAWHFPPARSVCCPVRLRNGVRRRLARTRTTRGSQRLRTCTRARSAARPGSREGPAELLQKSWGTGTSGWVRCGEGEHAVHLNAKGMGKNNPRDWEQLNTDPNTWMRLCTRSSSALPAFVISPLPTLHLCFSFSPFCLE